jgi:hypothetical protein
VKPADYYLGSRDFFGIMLPGTLCVIGAFVAVERHPFQRAGTATLPHILVAVLIAYAVGYVLQAVVQRVVHRWFQSDAVAQWVHAVPTPQPEDRLGLTALDLEDEARRIMVRVDPLSSRFTSLHHWCRRVIEERAHQLQVSLPDVERQVQFLMAMPLALMVLSAGIAISHDWRLALASAAGAAIFLFRFLEMRAYQRRSWLTKVLMLDALGALGSYDRVPIAISPETMATAFRSATGVRFSWDRYLAERWPTSLEVLKSDVLRARTVNMFFPWYLDQERQWVAFEQARARGARPIRISEIAGVVNSLPKERADAILGMSQQFRTDGKPVLFAVTGYALADGRLIVMDGNHRLAAATLAACDVTVLFFVVRGPRDPDALPDVELHKE